LKGQKEKGRRNTMQDDSTFKQARGNICMPIVLITAHHDGVNNVMTAAWSSPSSFYPPLMNISIGTTRFTHDLIMKGREFAINILADDQMDLAVFCGNVSGRDTDKFKEKKISTRTAKKICPPLINGCVANIECELRNYFQTGDHTLFVGETVAYEEDVSKNPLVRFRGMFFKASEPLGEDEHPAKV
jgi:flavin reductase (DIM6/NTAB) family NADH-FMN oxidoreductase RutF